MDVDFVDITYEVNAGWKEHGENKTILHGVSGHFGKGRLTAIMGPSGAGKSTLLNVVSGYRAHNGKGYMKVNNKPMIRRKFQKSSRYITQEDLLPAYMTVKEAMVMAASLKLPESMSLAEKGAIVLEKLNVLGLVESQNTQTTNLSGGQKKRLSIALELISNPTVFFLDEPTSGLDDVSTKCTVRLLNSLARNGHTIVCTIHQPSASLMELFDDVYILAKGKCVYQGSTSNLLPFLSSSGYQCPTYHNPWDYVIEVVESSENNISTLSKAMENGRITQHPLADETYQIGFGIKSENSTLMMDKMCEDKIDEYVYETSAYHQFLILLARMMRRLWRNKLGLQLQLIHHFSCAVLAGIGFWGYAKDGHQSVNMAKFAVGYVLFHAYTNLMMPVLNFPDEVKILKKEHFNRWYKLSAYYAAHTLSKLPGQMIFSLIFSTIVYVMTGIPIEPIRFMLFSLIGILTVFASDALGETVGSSVTATTGAALAPAIMAPFLGFAVYGLDFASRISGFTKFVISFSFMRNGVLATLITLFGLNRGKLDCYEIYCHFQDSKTMLRFVGLEGSSVWTELLPIIAAVIIFRAICYYTLRLRLSIDAK